MNIFRHFSSPKFRKHSDTSTASNQAHIIHVALNSTLGDYTNDDHIHIDWKRQSEVQYRIISILRRISGKTFTKCVDQLAKSEANSKNSTFDSSMNDIW